jgi:hypothetical protein
MRLAQILPLAFVLLGCRVHEGTERYADVYVPSSDGGGEDGSDEAGGDATVVPEGSLSQDAADSSPSQGDAN